MIARLLRGLRGLFGAMMLPRTKDYHHFKRILIPTSRGTSEIDHLIVSRFGVFVIELKDRSGWIFGEENDAYWTAVHFRDKFKFQNPLRQNYGHMKALQEFLGIDMEKMHPLVVFRGAFEFKTPMPRGVRGHEFASFVREKSDVLLDDSEVERLVRLLENADRESGFVARWRHARAVHDRYADVDKCPKCGGRLLVRVAKNGQHAGTEFLGCSNYPECKYLRGE